MDSIRGVSFMISQETNNSLWLILRAIQVERFNWYCIRGQQEAWLADRKTDLFEDSFYNGDRFKNRIKEPHLIIFLKLQAYNPGMPCDAIHSYEDFKKSACQIVLLVYDCEYVELYFKDSSLAQKAYATIKSNRGFSNLTYITDRNDERMGFDVL